ncbi:PulJ/GspJ family protein [Prochlorococcus marinus]|uniref:PulJ/GspJ family protein n=1 Tax=Prochlorococcus marinus TaxID=1219 RepID=UPI0007B3986D|nr:type II secretion system protein [Prochlorococcus marinus]KZR76691.1 hypothetical protein PMIT1320_00599 [Prochlorococcus marinus str. MIT 1320]
MVKYIIPRRKNKEVSWSHLIRKEWDGNLSQASEKLFNQAKVLRHEINANIFILKFKKILTTKLKSIAFNTKRIPAINHQRGSGFTLVEVLIAGTIISMVMAAVSRISLAALTNSMHQHERTTIEADINNNIQLLQHADSQLTDKKILADNELEAACEDPAKYLNSQIINSGGDFYVGPPSSNGRKRANRGIIKRSTITNDNSGNLIIVYSFEGPGVKKELKNGSTKLLHDTELQNATEQRIFELSPQFQAELCGLGNMTHEK